LIHEVVAISGYTGPLGLVPMLAVTIEERRQGLERIRHRGDDAQAQCLDRWLNQLTTIYAASILPFEAETAHGEEAANALVGRWPSHAGIG
jgi:hypothetical protein